MVMWDMIPATLWHGALGIWDEVISWGIFLIVAVVVGAFFYQQWRERDDDEDEFEDADLYSDTLPDEPKDNQS